MAKEIKNLLSGGLDLDTAYPSIGKTNYIDALNISQDSVLQGRDEIITNIVSNRLISYTYPLGTGKVIGAFEHQLRNVIIFFRYNSNGRHGIYEYNKTTDLISKIFECFTDSATDILNFTINDKIDFIDVVVRPEGDLIFFIDSLKRPSVFNSTRFKAGQYTPVTRDILNVAKIPPPLCPFNLSYANDTTRRSNDLRNKLFRFKTRDVFDDEERSTCSPISEVPYPISILDNTYTSIITNNNYISLSFIKGGKNVKAVELLVSYSDKKDTWTDFSLVEKIDVTSYGIGATIPYSFYNNGTYADIDLEQSIRLFNYVPQKANVQVVVNGNVLAYAAIEEGYDKDLVPNVVNTVLTTAVGNGATAGGGSLNGVFNEINNNNTLQTYSITFSGSPVTGTVIKLTQRNTKTNALEVKATYTTVALDTPTTIATAIKNSFNATSNIGYAQVSGTQVVIVSNQVAGQYKRIFESLTITAPTGTQTTGTNSILTFPFSDTGEVALAYFDEVGRTNGVLYNKSYTTPRYNENVSEQVLLPYINSKIYHQPPIWAKSFQWMMLKNEIRFIYWYTINVGGDDKSLYFNVTNFITNALKSPHTKNVLNYAFEPGDRMRLIKRDSDKVIFDDTFDNEVQGLVTDPTLTGTVQKGIFLKVKRDGALGTVNYSSNGFIIQIYKPAQQLPSKENKTYYEIGRGYLVGDAGLSTRFHTGDITNQNFGTGVPAEYNFTKGDAYFRARNIPLSETGTATFSVLDRNFLDIYNSAVNNIDGRPNIIDVNIKKQYYGNLIRHGQALIQNTNINGLNAFPPENFAEVSAGFGDIAAMSVRDKRIIFYQNFKVGFIPIYSEIRKDGISGNLQIQTDKLLNPHQYYAGNYGTNMPSSLSVSDYGEQFCDPTNGAIVRLANNGADNVSLIYKMNAYANDNISLRTGQYKIYGCNDRKLSQYIIAMEATPMSPAQTLIFNHKKNRFVTFASYLPEMLCSLGLLVVSFKDGNLYTHDGVGYNNFYGVQYPSNITLIFNESNLIKKTYSRIGYQSENNKKWYVPYIKTNNINEQTGFAQESRLIENDFKLEESVLSADFLRDKNSMANPQLALVEGDFLKGNNILVKMEISATNAATLVSLIEPYIIYETSNKNL